MQASTQVATSIAHTTDGHINVYFANFAGLVGGSNPIQTPQNGVQVDIAAKSDLKGHFLPFMGNEETVQGTRNGDSISFKLPAITRGAVFWMEP